MAPRCLSNERHGAAGWRLVERRPPLWLATVWGSWVTCDDRLVRPTVLIVDDHHEFRTAARALLEADGFDVVGEAATGNDALAAVLRLRPHVVLLDIRLPDIDGFAVAKRLASLADPPQVVLVSSRRANARVARLRHVPARGFVAKSDLTGDAVRHLLAPHTLP